MNFAERHTRHVAVLEALARAVKEGKYKFDAETCFAKVEGDSSLAAAGEACLDIGNRVPKDSPDKKFINKINKQHLAQVKILQKGIAKFRPICEKLQGKEDAQKEESLTRAPLPPGHSRITTTITTITTTTTKEADAQRAP